MNFSKLVSILAVVSLLMLSVGAATVSAEEPTGTPTTEVAPASEPTQEATVAPADAATIVATEAITPTEEVTVEPTEEATVEPTEEATVEPTEEATVEPTEEATVEPTEEATVEPTEEATVEPTEEATVEPTATITPTEEATVEPTATITPTEEATVEPTATLTPTVEITPTATVTPTVAAAGQISAQATTPRWSTTIAVQNPSTSDTAEINLAYYDTSGNTVASLGNSTFNLVPHASKRIAASDISGTTFQGSAVIASSVNVAAAVFMVDSANGNTVDMYGGSGSTQVDTTLYFALVHRQPATGHWYSTIVLQNTGGQSANVTIYFKTVGAATPVYSVTDTIPTQASHYYDLQTSAYSPINTRSGNNDWYGSAQVVSSMPLAGKLIQRNTDTGVTAVHNAFASSESATKYYIPLAHCQPNTWGWNGWIFVLNTNATTATVRGQYIYRDGTQTDQEIGQVPPYGSYLFYPNTRPLIHAKDPSWYGSMILTSQNGVSFVAQYSATNLLKPRNLYYLYKGIKDGGGSLHLAYPYIESRNPSYVSWPTVQNIGATTATITIQYYGLNGAVARTAIVQQLGPGASAAHTAAGDGLTNFSGSAEISSNQPIAGFGSTFEGGRQNSGYDVCGAYDAMGY
jgi:hypothetical protein